MARSSLVIFLVLVLACPAYAETAVEQLELSKEISLAKKRKELAELLLSIGTIQQQCIKAGFHCAIENNQAVFTQLSPQQPTTQMENQSPTSHSALSSISLIAIVGGRARFRINDETIQELSVGDRLGQWQLIDVGIESATLQRGERFASYRITPQEITSSKP